jgi:hypothetical protein
MLSVFMPSVVYANVVMQNVVSPAPMQCLHNELLYFATVVSYERKMLIKLVPDGR